MIPVSLQFSGFGYCDVLLLFRQQWQEGHATEWSETASDSWVLQCMRLAGTQRYHLHNKPAPPNCPASMVQWCGIDL